MIRIGVIDSGIGGLSIVKSCIDYGAYGEYLYVYDNKYHPYGKRDKEELTAIAFLNIENLVKRGAEVIVIACNTLTSAAIDDMRKTFRLPIIGTEPAIKPAARDCDKIAVLATPYMVTSQRMKSLVAQYQGKSISFPDCSGLATAIEYGYDNHEFMHDRLSRVLQRYSDTEGVVLGCTHYAFSRTIIQEILPHAKIYDSGAGVARRLKSCFSPLHWSDDYIIRLAPTQNKLDCERQIQLSKLINNIIFD